MKLFGISLPLQILIAIVLAVFAGVFFGDLMQVLMPIGDGFIMLLRMSILPYLTFALMHGIGSLEVSQAKRLLRYGGLFLLALWSATIVTMYAFAMVFPQSNVAYYYAGAGQAAGDAKSFLALFIPANPFHALAFNIVPAVVLFSVFFGSALMILKRKEHVLKVLDTAISALTRITQWVIALSPIGIFALISATVGTLSLGQFQKLEIYLISFIIMTAFLTFWAMPLVLMAFTPIKYRELLRNLQPALLLAFSTGNIFVSLPYLMKGINSITEHHTKQSEESYTITKALVPVAYNLPLVGNLMSMYFILFLSFFYAIDFTPLDDVKLTITSFFVLAGPVTAAFNSMPFLLDILHLPHEATGLFVETMSITRNLQALAGTMGIAVFTLLTAFAFSKRVLWRPLKILVTIGLAAVVLVGLVVAVQFSVPAPRPERPVFLDLTIDDPVQTTVYRKREEPSPAPEMVADEDTLDRIRRTGVIRMGYNADVMPLSYFNHKGELVGYDIAVANALARSLDARIEFIPFEYDQLIEDLDEDRFDIAMSAVSVTDERLEHLAFSIPSTVVEAVLIAPDYERRDYTDLDRVVTMRDLKVGVLRGSAFEALAKRVFPLAQIVPLDSYTEILADPSPVDVALWTDQEGYTFTVMNPSYSIVATKPSIGKDFYAYAMRSSDEPLQSYVDYWLKLRALDGFTERVKEKWIQGKQPKVRQRWSIIHNVLHWTD